MLEFVQPADDRQCDPSLEPFSNVTAFQTVRLIPAVLKRILSCVHPADNVNCLPAHWHLQSVASTQFHFRLVEPKNGMLLLRWHTTFITREDVRHPLRQYRFINLIRYNVARELATGDENLVMQQVTPFLVGYEALMLNEVLANVKLYANLNIFMIDFSAGRDGMSEWCDQRFLPYVAQTRPAFLMPASAAFAATALTDQVSNVNTHEHNLFSSFMLFMDSGLWVKVITAVAKECAGSLLHFILNDGVCPEEGFYNVQLPRQFYRSLQLKPMLADMQNLQTLHLPSIDRNEPYGWKVPTICPLFPLDAVTDSITGRFVIALAVYTKGMFDYSSSYIDKWDSVAARLLSDKLRYFLNVLAPQRYKIINRTQNDSKGHNFAGNARAYIHFWVNEHPVGRSARDTLKVVLSVLRERQRQSCDRTCFTIVVGASNANWVLSRGILDILPLFVAANNDGGSYACNQVNDNGVQIRVKNAGGSFSSSMESWKNRVENIGGHHVSDEDRAQFSEYKQQLLSKQFKLPKIFLHAKPEIFVKPDVQRGRKFPYGIKPKLLCKEKKLALVNKIEALVMQEVMSFVRDAVECCRSVRPRDVCFYMYQSLRSCTFAFNVTIEERKWPNASVEIRRVLRNRAALFEQTVLRAVFKELLPAGLDGETRLWLYKDTPMLINALGTIARNLTINCMGRKRLVPFRIYRSQSRLKKVFK